MVFGRKQEASDEGTGPLKHPQAAAAARRRHVPPGDRRDLGCGGQHVHQRRLHQFARRQSRQERQLDQVVGRTGRRAGPVQYAAQHRRRRAGQHLCRRPRQCAASRCSTAKAISCANSRSTCRSIRTRSRRSATSLVRMFTARMAPGAPWAICITPGRTQYLYSSDAYPGRIYKLSLDGKVLGLLGESGKQLEEFGWIHEIACPSENEFYVAGF